MSLSFFNDFRLKFTIVVTGYGYFAFAVIAGDSFFAIAVTLLPFIVRRPCRTCGQLCKHRVCDCCRNCCREQSFSHSRDVSPSQLQASVRSFLQTAFSVLPEYLLCFHSLPSEAERATFPFRLIRDFCFSYQFTSNFLYGHYWHLHSLLFRLSMPPIRAAFQLVEKVCLFIK